MQHPTYEPLPVEAHEPADVEAGADDGTHPQDRVGRNERWAQMRRMWKGVMAVWISQLIIFAVGLALLPLALNLIFGALAVSGFRKHRTGRIWALWFWWMVEYALLTGLLVWAMLALDEPLPWWVLAAYVVVSISLGFGMGQARVLCKKIGQWKRFYGDLCPDDRAPPPAFPGRAMAAPAVAMQPMAAAAPQYVMVAQPHHQQPQQWAQHVPHQAVAAQPFDGAVPYPVASAMYAAPNGQQQQQQQQRHTQAVYVQHAPAVPQHTPLPNGYAMRPM